MEMRLLGGDPQPAVGPVRCPRDVEPAASTGGLTVERERPKPEPVWAILR